MGESLERRLEREVFIANPEAIQRRKILRVLRALRIAPAGNCEISQSAVDGTAPHECLRSETIHHTYCSRILLPAALVSAIF